MDKEITITERRERRKLELSKLQDLFDDYGVTEDEFMAEYCFDSIVPAICMEPDCNATYEYEPDSENGYCENCQKNSVTSGLRLLGQV